VYDVGPFATEEEARSVLDLVDDDERFRQVILLNDNIVKTMPASLAVAPHRLYDFEQALHGLGVQYTLVNSDLQASFDANMEDNEERMAKISQRFLDDPTLFDHEAYLRYSDQVAWVQAAAAGSSIASTFTLGTSYEGRAIIGLTINAGTNLPAIYVDSNIHAREWIASATTLYMIDQILTGTSADAVDMRNNYRWYFVPNLNPDGYEYTWTTDRLWRKTRSPNSGSACTGTDANRNWDSNWGGEGSSPLPCSDTYHGARAFSEVETAAARDFLLSIVGHTNVFISIHCYSNLWLVPFGGTPTKPADYNELMRVGNLAAAAIRSVNGLNFQVGTPPDILYVAAGGSFDWAKENGFQYGYSPELRPATAAQGGFEIPASNIVLSGAEIFASLVAVAKNANH
jgi:hypothetical protein